MADKTAAEQVKQVELTAEEIKTAEVKELLKRFGLKRALVDQKTGNVHFDEAYIKRLDPKAHTEITAE